MTLPSADHLFQVSWTTWPAAEEIDLGPYRLRRSPGGGQRVSAATAMPGAAELAEWFPRAEAQMLAWGQTPIFQILPDTPGLDALCDGAGYVAHDPVLLYAAPVAVIAGLDVPRLSTFTHWPPLAIQHDIWAEGGIGRDRVAVMERVRGAKTSILARRDDRPVGTGFAAIHQGVAMLHAVEVRAAERRHGDGRRMMAAAARWAAEAGADHIALAVTEGNVAARSLYAGIGMEPVTRYHYRVRG